MLLDVKGQCCLNRCACVLVVGAWLLQVTIRAQNRRHLDSYYGPLSGLATWWRKEAGAADPPSLAFIPPFLGCCGLARWLQYRTVFSTGSRWTACLGANGASSVILSPVLYVPLSFACKAAARGLALPHFPKHFSSRAVCVQNTNSRRSASTMPLLHANMEILF